MKRKFGCFIEYFIEYVVCVLNNERGGPKIPSGKREPYQEPPPHTKRVYDESGRHTGYVERECFIATACLEAQGLPAYCEELNILRDFRDHFIRRLPLGNALVKIYYLIAPRIVASIDRRADADFIYRDLYKNIVLISVDLVRRGKNRTAFIEALKTGVWLTAKYFFKIRKF